MIILLLLVVGVITGILAGIFGIGGGTLFTPVLFLLFNATGIEQPVPWTIGTSLFCTFSAAFSSSIQQFHQHNSFLREGVKVGLFGAVGVYLGKQIVTSPYYTEPIFVSFFAVILMSVSYMFFKRGHSDRKIRQNSKLIDLRKSSLTGLGGGFVAALAGVGGGVVVVPVLNLWYKVVISKAISISSLAVLIISLSGWMQFAFLSGTPNGATGYTVGFVDFGTGLPLILGAFVGGFIGVRIGGEFSQSLLQKLFSGLAVIVAVLMIASVI